MDEAPRARWLVVVRAVGPLAVLLAGLAVWLRVATLGFVAYDDTLYIQDNDLVNGGLSWHAVLAAFTEVRQSNWHPLTWISHMVDVQLFGLEPMGPHIESVLWHALAAAFLFCALREATSRVGLALFVAAAFFMHPLRVQSVAWLAERKDVLCAAFWMGAVWAWVRHARTGSRASLVVVVGAALGAILAKPMAVTLPASLVMLDVWPLQRFDGTFGGAWRLVREKAPLLLVSAVASGITVVAQQAAVSTVEARALSLRAEAAIVAIVRYVGMTAWPHPISVSHPLYLEQPTILPALAALVLVVVAVVVAVRARRAAPWFLAGLGWLLVTLLPVVGLVQVGSEAFADRYSYIPSIGLFCAAAEGVRVSMQSARDRWIVRVVAASLLVAWSARTWTEIPAWRDPVSLRLHAVEVQPDDAQARIELARVLMQIGALDDARAHVERAVALKANAWWYDLLALIHVRQDHLDEAAAALETATTIDPTLAPLWVHLAHVEDLRGAVSEAAAARARAEQLGTRAAPR